MATASGNYPNIQATGSAYDNRLPGGYTPEHRFFGSEASKWSERTLPPRRLPPRGLPLKGPNNIIGDIAVRVSMGTVPSGGRNIKTVGVSFTNIIEVLCADT
jgi:hypothetical protein